MKHSMDKVKALDPIDKFFLSHIKPATKGLNCYVGVVDAGLNDGGDKFPGTLPQDLIVILMDLYRLEQPVKGPEKFLIRPVRHLLGIFGQVISLLFYLLNSVAFLWATRTPGKTLREALSRISCASSNPNSFNAVAAP